MTLKWTRVTFPQKILICFIIFGYLATIFSDPINAIASGKTIPQQTLRLEFLYIGEDDEIYIDAENFTYSHRFTEAEQALILFTNLIDNRDEGKILFIPPFTVLEDLQIIDDTMYLFVNEPIDTFRSSYMERIIMGQILLNSLQFPSVKYVTLVIDGVQRPLSGGLETTDIPITDVFSLLGDVLT